VTNDSVHDDDNIGINIEGFFEMPSRRAPAVGIPNTIKMCRDAF
jgi:hypothetical protein